jgi:hypothetical protein
MPKLVRGARWAAVFVALLGLEPLRATTVVPPTFPELVHEAETIVRGVVTQQRTEEFDSPQGRGIRTLVTLQVERALKGSPGETLTVTMLGGTVGRRTLHIAGVPQFRVGERQIVFVAHNGRAFCPVIAGGHGRYFIRADATGREFIARDNGAPLGSVDAIALPLSVSPVVLQLQNAASGISCVDFESQILAALPRSPVELTPR